MSNGGALADLRNIGPVTAEWCRQVGIDTAEDLSSAGAAETYVRIADTLRPDATLTLLWALAGAIFDLDWRHVPAEMKASLIEEVACLRAAAPPIPGEAS